MNKEKRFFTVVIGTVIAAYGICLAINAGFGGATLAVLWEGVHLVTHMTIGQASFVIAFLMVAFCWFYDRKQVSWGTVIFQLIYSPCIDLFSGMVFYTDSVIFNAVLMVLGIVILSFGSALYSFADFGRGSYEAITLAFVHRKGWKTGYVRIVIDILCVVFGALLGGKFGLCTIATILISGPLLQFFLNMFGKINNKIHFLDVE